MKIIRGINKIRKFKKPVAALGVFDGVHLGHRNILKAAVRKACSINGTSVALTFWPHPQKQESLYSLEHRLRLIQELGIDVCVVINFNKKFAKTTAEDFIKNVLVRKLGAHYIYVGKNFRFGKDAKGDCKTLEEFSKRYNFKLKVFNVIKINPVRNTTQIKSKAVVSNGVNKKAISSTYIRKLIKEGRLEAAEKLLMRRVGILGTVVKGNFLGRRLGFPTANINPHHEVIPPKGVYAVRIIFDSKKLDGICYIGTKPTLKTKRTMHIEVHIFNFNKNIYGKYLEIQFIKKIRDEIKFDSIPALAAQIKEDIKTLRTCISRHVSIPQYMPF